MVGLAFVSEAKKYSRKQHNVRSIYEVAHREFSGKGDKEYLCIKKNKKK